MTFNFGFNINNGQEDINKIIEVCKQYSQCINCPIMNQGYIKFDNSDNITSCSTAIIRKIQKQHGKR